MRFLRTGLCMIMLCAFRVHATQDFNVVAQARGSAVAIDARATLTAPYAIIWNTLTDYSRLAEFIPGMRVSQVTERDGPTTIIEQQGTARFLVFSYDIDVVVAATVFPPNSIEVRALKGNLKRFSGRYRITHGDVPGTQLLRWIGIIEPTIPLPAFIGVPLIRRNIEDQFRGMVDEIERRELARRVTPTAGELR